MRDCILENGGQYLKDCAIFDVYTGGRIAPGSKSVAFSLTMRADDQTLTDEHAEETVRAVLAALRERFGAEMR
jgi:phenylalanyl-tRNA synthetase beta chain